MKRQAGITKHLLFILVAVLLTSPAWAEKPHKAKNAGHKTPHHQKRTDDFRRADAKHRSHRRSAKKHSDRYLTERFFDDRHRQLVGGYYRDEFRRGHCPPGLAKKHNGCLPPGQAKRWAIGRPLPRNVIFHDLPDRLMRQVGYPPSGYRFVRVASDILMITIGTGLVVDAIADLNAMH